MTYTNWAKEIRPYMEKAAVSLSDADALGAVSLYPAWKAGRTFLAGERVQYQGMLYRVLQDHTAQETWTPDAAPSLFARVLIPDEEVIPDWVQPESTNPYMTGDKVRYNGAVWVSTVDNNVWTPGVYGWEEVSE